MHRFFVTEQAPEPGSGPSWSAGTELNLSETDAAHVARVLRLKPGHSVVISDGRGFDYEAELVRVAPKSVVVRLGAPEPSKAEPGLFLTLIQGIAKGSKMDLIIQKAVEVGVSRIIPVDTERTVVRLDGSKAGSRVERWQRIAYEAAKQARRGRIPKVESVHGWSDLWQRDDLGFVLLPWEAEDGRGLLETVREVPVTESAVTVVIGPEGGLSAEEVGLAAAHGARVVTMGPRILRTETASIVAAALVLGALGEIG